MTIQSFFPLECSRSFSSSLLGLGSCQVPTWVCLLIEMFSVGSEAHLSAQWGSAVCSELTEGFRERKKQKEGNGGKSRDKGRRTDPIKDGVT